MQPARILATMPPRARLGLVAGAVAVVVVLFLLLRLAGAPSYATLASGLDPADTGKITTALDEQGIGYELQANGTTVAVNKADVARARVALAGQGLGGVGAATPGFELFDEQKLGASDFQQQVTYQRALEGEIARTITSVAGVSGAQVQLVLPEEDLFADTSTPATAAVLLSGAGGMLDAGAVRGIAQLVSSSVKGLQPDKVTITDGSGRLLWPAGDGAGAAAGDAGKQSAEARYAQQLETSINAMLARTLGPGKAQVQVNAQLDMDRVTRDELRYARRGVPLKTVEETERLRGSGARAGGAAGTAGNIPQYAGGAAGGAGNSNYRHESRSTEFGVDKTVSKIEEAPGSVERLSVALLVDESVANPAPIKNAVAAAAGIDPERGDTITQTVLAFARPPVAKTGPVPATMIEPIKWGALGLGAIVFLFFMARHLRRREREPLAAPAWLAEISEPVRLSELEAGRAQPAPELPTLPPRARHESMHKLDQLMEREPERVAAQVRQWMSED